MKENHQNEPLSTDEVMAQPSEEPKKRHTFLDSWKHFYRALSGKTDDEPEFVLPYDEEYDVQDYQQEVEDAFEATAPLDAFVQEANGPYAQESTDGNYFEQPYEGMPQDYDGYEGYAQEAAFGPSEYAGADQGFAAEGDPLYYDPTAEYDQQASISDAYPQEAYGQETYTEEAYAQDAYVQEGYAQEGYGPEGYTQEGYGPEAYAQEPYAPEAYQGPRPTHPEMADAAFQAAMRGDTAPLDLPQDYDDSLVSQTFYLEETAPLPPHTVGDEPPAYFPMDYVPEQAASGYQSIPTTPAYGNPEYTQPSSIGQAADMQAPPLTPEPVLPPADASVYPGAEPPITSYAGDGMSELYSVFEAQRSGLDGHSQPQPMPAEQESALTTGWNGLSNEDSVYLQTQPFSSLLDILPTDTSLMPENLLDGEGHASVSLPVAEEPFQGPDYAALNLHTSDSSIAEDFLGNTPAEIPPVAASETPKLPRVFTMGQAGGAAPQNTLPHFEPPTLTEPSQDQPSTPMEASAASTGLRAHTVEHTPDLSAPTGTDAHSQASEERAAKGNQYIPNNETVMKAFERITAALRSVSAPDPVEDKPMSDASGDSPASIMDAFKALDEEEAAPVADAVVMDMGTPALSVTASGFQASKASEGLPSEKDTFILAKDTQPAGHTLASDSDIEEASIEDALNALDLPDELSEPAHLEYLDHLNPGHVPESTSASALEELSLFSYSLTESVLDEETLSSLSEAEEPMHFKAAQSSNDTFTLSSSVLSTEEAPPILSLHMPIEPILPPVVNSLPTTEEPVPDKEAIPEANERETEDQHQTASESEEAEVMTAILAEAEELSAPAPEEAPDVAEASDADARTLEVQAPEAEAPLSPSEKTIEVDLNAIIRPESVSDAAPMADEADTSETSELDETPIILGTMLPPDAIDELEKRLDAKEVPAYTPPIAERSTLDVLEGATIVPPATTWLDYPQPSDGEKPKAKESYALEEATVQGGDTYHPPFTEEMRQQYYARLGELYGEDLALSSSVRFVDEVPSLQLGDMPKPVSEPDDTNIAPLYDQPSAVPPLPTYASIEEAPLNRGVLEEEIPPVELEAASGEEESLNEGQSLPDSTEPLPEAEMPDDAQASESAPVTEARVISQTTADDFAAPTDMGDAEKRAETPAPLYKAPWHVEETETHAVKKDAVEKHDSSTTAVDNTSADPETEASSGRPIALYTAPWMITENEHAQEEAQAPTAASEAASEQRAVTPEDKEAPEAVEAQDSADEAAVSRYTISPPLPDSSNLPESSSSDGEVSDIPSAIHTAFLVEAADEPESVRTVPPVPTTPYFDGVLHLENTTEAASFQRGGLFETALLQPESDIPAPVNVPDLPSEGEVIALEAVPEEPIQAVIHVPELPSEGEVIALEAVPEEPIQAVIHVPELPSEEQAIVLEAVPEEPIQAVIHVPELPSEEQAIVLEAVPEEPIQAVIHAPELPSEEQAIVLEAVPEEPIQAVIHVPELPSEEQAIVLEAVPEEPIQIAVSVPELPSEEAAIALKGLSEAPISAPVNVPELPSEEEGIALNSIPKPPISVPISHMQLSMEEESTALESLSESALDSLLYTTEHSVRDSFLKDAPPIPSYPPVQAAQLPTNAAEMTTVPEHLFKEEDSMIQPVQPLSLSASEHGQPLPKGEETPDTMGFSWIAPDIEDPLSRPEPVESVNEAPLHLAGEWPATVLYEDPSAFHSALQAAADDAHEDTLPMPVVPDTPAAMDSQPDSQATLPERDTFSLFEAAAEESMIKAAIFNEGFPASLPPHLSVSQAPLEAAPEVRVNPFAALGADSASTMPVIPARAVDTPPAYTDAIAEQGAAPDSSGSSASEPSADTAGLDAFAVVDLLEAVDLAETTAAAPSETPIGLFDDASVDGNRSDSPAPFAPFTDFASPVEAVGLPDFSGLGSFAESFGAVPAPTPPKPEVPALPDGPMLSGDAAPFTEDVTSTASAPVVPAPPATPAQPSGAAAYPAPYEARPGADRLPAYEETSAPVPPLPEQPQAQPTPPTAPEEKASAPEPAISFVDIGSLLDQFNI